MMNSQALTALVLALAFSTAIRADGQETGAKHTFPIQWKAGKKYLQTMTMKQQMKMLGQGDMETNMSMEISLLPAAGETEGSTKLKMTYEKAEVKGVMGGQELPVGDVGDLFVGKSITAVYDESGRMVDIEGLEELAGGNPVTAQMLNEDSMKQMMAQGSLMAQPSKPVGPGESWEFSFAYPTPMMKVTLKGKYTYEKDEEVDGDKCARLTLEGALTLDAGDAEGEEEENPAIAQARAAMKAMGLKITDSKMSGVCHYSYAMANISQSTVELEMNMSMKNPETQENMEMPIKTKATNALKMQDAK